MSNLCIVKLVDRLDIVQKKKGKKNPETKFQDLVENRGLEPLTLGLQSRCSSQLS